VGEGIRGFLALATGPATLCGRLRRETRPVRRPPRAVEALGRVGSTFPAALVGSELLALLGERLRGLVLEPAAAADEEAGLRALSRRLTARLRDERPPRRPVAAPPPSAERPGEPSLAPSEPSEPARAAAAWAKAAAPTHMAGGPPPAGGRREPLSGAALLEERLRVYWRTVARERGRVHAGAWLAQAVRASRPTPAGVELDPLPRAPMTEAEIARELRAFVDGRTGERSAPAQAAPVGADGAGQEPRHGFAASPGFGGAGTPGGAAPPPAAVPAHTLGPTFGVTAASRAAARRELADELAAILREQAVRHGIDLP
jgi:hypothetical protein